MSLLSRLFGGSKSETPAAESEEYNGFRITPEPIKEGQVFRLAAVIETERGGETLTHRLIRADTLSSRDQAAAASLAKAKQVIDEQGIALFG